MTKLEQIKYVKEKANIVDVIGHFVQLKRYGSGYKGISPFTNERNASFTVHPVKRIFKCFSSGKSGDVIDFVMISQGYNYTDAIAWIINFYNLPPTDSDWNYSVAPEIPISYLSNDLAVSTLRYEPPNGSVNYFTKWLAKIFDDETANGLIIKYCIGTSKHWTGANIFWQVDISGSVRGGKIMVYNPETGKRIKEPQPLITWVHKVAKMTNYNLSQCLFGEHLISQFPDRVIKIVESEKTAIVASIIYPEFNWLASCSLTNLSISRCACLKGKTISLIPDTGAEDAWIEKCTQLRGAIQGDWVVDIIPGNNPKGYDLCDYILDNLI